jgi:uncharacterized protein (DUF2267 family)
MPMPWSYRHATKDWRAFLADAQERLGTPTDNTTYTAVQGVLIAFRRRLTPRQAAAFAQALPAVLRALFFDGWNPDDPPRPFASRAEMAAEARALRPHHNLTPDHAIEAVAWALRRHVHQDDLDRVLATLPEGAIDFWAVPVEDPNELERRIV